jgi:ARG/rhodanese/phosphatase superfamily protein
MPVPGRNPRQTGYLPLEEALRRNLVTITEQARASVPELLAASVADAPVVLVGGEQVIGGLQNRVLNTTILVQPHTELQIPVTCVEAGRWHDDSMYMDSQEHVDLPPPVVPTQMAEPAQRVEPAPRRAASRAFSSDQAAYAQLRKLHAKSVTASLSAGDGYRSDQGAVWGEVAERMTVSRSYSPSGAMQALYEAPERARKLKEAMQALKRPEGALGFVALLNDTALGAELFVDETLASAYWDKLARSYIVEALDAQTPDAAAHASDERRASDAEARLLEDALAADIQVHPSPGMGMDARLTGGRVSGAGLVHDGVAIHLSLFPEDPTNETPQPQRAGRPTDGFGPR